jgi:hypothetical protein
LLLSLMGVTSAQRILLLEVIQRNQDHESGNE